MIGMACAAAFCPCAAARAQDADAREAAWSLEAAVSAVSDYRFRGYSLSDKQPALQPELSVVHASGLYAYAWGSTLGSGPGPDVETDLGIGFARTIGPVAADLSANWYFYPGAADLNYLELRSSFSTAAGAARVGVELAYVPPQRSLAGVTNRYAAVNGAVPLPGLPVTLSASFGVEDGAFGNDKRDWSLGISGAVSGFELSASYVDAAHTGHNALADATVVLSARKCF